eukprot:2571986-Amphidinium_carterae.1
MQATERETSAETEVRRQQQQQRQQQEEQARQRVAPQVVGVVDTRLLSKPDSLSGKETDWPQFALHVRAYVGAISPRMLELLKRAEDPEVGIDRVDLDPGDDVHDSQLYYILTMLLKSTATDKVTLVDYGEGFRLERRLIEELSLIHI